MNKPKSKNYKIWFYSEKSLEAIGEKLLEKGVIKSFEYDYENAYEWIEAQSNDLQIEFNFSRKHSLMLMYDGNEPLDETVEQLASVISVISNSSVFLGNINYLGRDDYEYIKTKAINPCW